MTGRWKVACINWSSSGAPHAVAYFCTDDRRVLADRYFDTWREAFDYADRMARAER